MLDLEDYSTRPGAAADPLEPTLEPTLKLLPQMLLLLLLPLPFRPPPWETLNLQQGRRRGLRELVR